MAYMFSGFGASCASSSGFGCWPTDEFFLDSSKVLHANQLYQQRYKRDIPERVAAGLRDKSGYCTSASIDEYVRTHPPLSTDNVAEEVLEERADNPPPPSMPGMPSLASSSAPAGLPSWAIPAAAAGVALLAIVLVMKKKKAAA